MTARGDAVVIAQEVTDPGGPIDQLGPGPRAGQVIESQPLGVIEGLGSQTVEEHARSLPTAELASVTGVDLDEALAVLGVSRDATADEVRAAYRRLVSAAHPDRADAAPDATRQTARVTQAYAVIRHAPPESARPADTGPDPTSEAVAAETDQDSITLGAPADEAFAALFEAAGRVGHVAYFDRQLGILETVVRFEGGPSCSVLITLQGRAYGTEAFCTMESIEAAPTPPIAPVVEALVQELTAAR